VNVMNCHIGKCTVLPVAIGAALVFLLIGCHQGGRTQTSEGDRLYRAKCASCHRLVAPDKYESEQWHAFLANHGPRMTETERTAIADHLVRRSAGTETAARADGSSG